jgi:hypothetical protein
MLEVHTPLVLAPFIQHALMQQGWCTEDLYIHVAENGCEALPLVGFDRNQPFRRFLGQHGIELELLRLNPAIQFVHHGNCFPRPASVEKWLGTCEGIYGTKGQRDFWESVWNLSVSAWNSIDLTGEEPWIAPEWIFPLTHPAYWKGAKWNRFLYQPAARFVKRFGFNAGDGFIDFLEGLLNFSYGRNLDEVPMGMAALAWNAPNESYAIRPNQLSAWGLPGQVATSIYTINDEKTFNPPLSILAQGPNGEGLGVRSYTTQGPEIRSGITKWHPAHPSRLPGFGVFWEMDLEYSNCPPDGEYQIFLSQPELLPIAGPIQVRISSSQQTLYLRTQQFFSQEDIFSLSEKLPALFQANFPSLQPDRIRSIYTTEPLCLVIDGVGTLRIEQAAWPWLGPVRTWLGFQQWLKKQEGTK